MVLKRLLAAAQQECYIFSRQVKHDRLQLLLIARPLSLSSKNTATTKDQIRSESIACDREWRLTNKKLCGKMRKKARIIPK